MATRCGWLSAEAARASRANRSTRPGTRVSAVALPQLHVEPVGALLAAASGAVTSALGYVVWYAALRRLTATRAAVVQLAVPILAAVGGVVWLAEMVSVRLVLSTVMVVGGIGLALAGRESA